ncbi:hypothetical protein BV25DRAFT_1818736 [Artomyces pyxidatus]|uniref:Uncharacterized protein n=1 Tax=Artomyces pyxidatus TaxID=48021 RepID=A0ACB8TIQ1_9AGAM|nr:hypothetical protein BV25DRAFT_1818736 [Artomyces pyxidatus]
MQPHRGHGLPPRPSFNPPQPVQPWTQAAAALTSVLANPYAAQQQSPHYAQAYAQYYTGQQSTPEGYTYSSTYNGPIPGPSHSVPAPRATRTHAQPAQVPAPWYSPGSSRCSHPGCAFTGSAKAVETHMMDRHLIYPPGWDKRKRRNDWDADPSLKGKPIPIQGTGIRLDTPADIEQWIAERKRRWPTAARVDEKRRKLEEAIARGQMYPGDTALRGTKRRRVEEPEGERGGGQRGGGQRGRGRGRGRGSDRGWGAGRGRGRGAFHGTPADGGAAQATLISPVPMDVPPEDSLSSSDDSDDDGAPEAVSSKPPADLIDAVGSSDSEIQPPEKEPPERMTDVPTPVPSGLPAQADPPRPIRRPPPPQPKRQPRNPFGSRPSLLRNLLQPEIRMTVSNLSQAIHFLVDNNFLENVELKPGQAAEKLIEVVGEQPAESSRLEPVADADATSAPSNIPSL